MPRPSGVIVEKLPPGHQHLDAGGRRPVRADAADLPPLAHHAGCRAGGEIQLTDGIARLLAEERVLAYAFEGRYWTAARSCYLRRPLISARSTPSSPTISRRFLWTRCR
ncbi:MAG: hypothetical protein IPO82_00010 [Betaproteobacteria bacterium]|nr:hypothetical protein [Betaproteobacteria bacterium]